MTQKIFGIGLSRTGGTSLHSALKRLGYRSYHHINFFHLYSLVKKDLSLNYEKVEKFDAIIDLPAVLNYKELDKKYPDAKFILTVRENRKKWLSSIENLHKNVRPWFRPFPYVFRFDKVMWGQLEFDEQIYSERYDNYIHEVKRYFQKRKNKLLVLDITKGEGYKKLCPFLGLPVLDESFPYKNKKIIKKVQK